MGVRMTQQAVGGRLRPQVRKIVAERLRARAGEVGVEIETDDWGDVVDGTARIVMGELEVPPTGEIEKLALRVVESILEDARRDVNGDLVLDLLLLYRWNRGEEASISPLVMCRVAWMERHAKRGRRGRGRRRR